jgi:hypothetical protein
MPEITWSQDEFSKGELSPMMYGRITVDAYYKGVKKGRNTITYPQGGIGKRFGTIYRNEITGITDWRDIFFESFPYLNEGVYLLAFVPGQIEIYLEDVLVATVTSALLTSDVIRSMDWTILDKYFRIAAKTIRPQDLVRSTTTTTINVGAGIVSNQFTLNAATTANIIFAVRFSNPVPADFPSTTPQIRAGITYFARSNGTGTLIKVYATAADASADVNAFTLTNAGAGVTTVSIANTWTLTPVTFNNLPQYDFNDNYESLTFQASATTGNITVTASGNIFSTAFIGGSILMADGVVSFTGFTSATQMTGTVTSTVSSTAAQPGRLCVLREPAWSDARGWPQKCSSFQNRAIFANTDSLQNGLFLSAINDYNNFDETNLPPDDDDAISYYPSSDTVNVINFIVPYRSLTVHTNTGIYSTPTSFETAITPKNFSLQLQESNPATAIQPQGVDNQIVIVTGNDVHTMLWDGVNNAYSSNIVSVTSEHLIRNPHDEISFINFTQAGSRYVFFVNEDGTLVIYQTLIAENVSGFTYADTGTIEKPAYFRWGASSPDGRAWFVIERQVANEVSPPYTFSTKYYIEELSFDVYTDCSYIYSGPPTSIIGPIPPMIAYNGQLAVGVGDGYGFSDEVNDQTFEFIAHGQPVDITEAKIGFPIEMEIQLMPNNLPGPGGLKGGGLFFPQHIRNAIFLFNNTIGGFVDGQPISILTFGNYNPLGGPLSLVGPPVPLTGTFKKTVMKGWNEFIREPLTITSSDPFDIRLIGVYYKIEG